MRVLVTGASSPLAQSLVNRLASQSAFALRILAASGESLPAHPERLVGDIRDPDVAGEAADQVEVIVHLQPLSLSWLPEADHAERLDTVMRGTRSLMLAATKAGVRRVVLGSTLAFFDRHPVHWHVDESWRPRPLPTLAHLLPWVGELSVRELVRRSHMEAICLRFGEVVDEVTASRQPFDPRWVHLQDAVHGLERALAFDHRGMLDAEQPDWSVFHIMAQGPHSKIKHGDETGIEERSTSASSPFLYEPQVDLARERPDIPIESLDNRPWKEILAPPEPIDSRPIRKVVLFGAGGPMGASAIRDLHESYTLRLTDIRALPDIVADLRSRESYECIIPPLLDAPHENRIVDVRDPDQVMAACHGMDAIINCSVLRMDPVDAFRVSAVGAYNMARAAIHHGIRRFIQTGPLLHLVHGHGSYMWDYQVPVDAPSRPYESLYFLSKYLGQEILRVFAEYHDLEVAVMLFCELVNPEEPAHQPPYFVSWPDAGRALRRALEVPELPSPYEEFNVSVDLPHEKYDHTKIRHILGWQPLDNLDHFWQDSH